ncbi:fungal-specific transcription factor domain-containing protein [Zychaea mexicana]|uniref:fungal-specific transcription factor domain-containing protein n=1 Tax=Zychaea mexicana TaxID=64656 RepID=UPI0022FE7040|nr:fungal-specific transcription factor domain-containing protein [Zychaea mexicana]KAI9474823.1 fungal-specific transcription factor domain-containing protein [Zychaea mexicana]
MGTHMRVSDCSKKTRPTYYVDNLEKRCKKMEKLLTSLTNASIKELERNDFRFNQQQQQQQQHRGILTASSSVASGVPATTKKNKKGKARATTSQISNDNSSNDDVDDSLESFSSDEDDDDIVSIESQVSDSNNNNNNNPTLEERLSNLDINDYDTITYTGRSASMDLLNTDLFRFRPFVPWPGRNDVALQLTAQNELMVVRSVHDKSSSSSSPSTTRLDIGLSMRSGGADLSATTTTTTTTATTTAASAIKEYDGSDVITPPSKEEQEKMIAFFFEHLHSFMPIINKSRFLSAEQPPNILVQAILALSFRFISQHEPAINPKAGDYATMYFTKVARRLRDPVRSRLCHVQSAVLMTLYLDMDDGDDSMQWYMLGTAIRMAQDLGLHRSCSHWKILPQAEIETRHRLFYACYVLDRWLSARAGKPLTILDRDFDTPMPANNEYQAFAIMIKLSEILGRVLKALYAPKAKHSNANAGLDDPTVIDAFDRRLKSCKAAMETELPFIQKAYLDIYYHTILLLLHRPFMAQQLSQQICTHAATTIMDLTRQIRQQQPKTIQYFSLCMPTCFVYALFQATLVHLSNAVRDPTMFEMFQQSAMLMQHYSHLVVVRRAFEIVELFRTMHAPAVDAAAKQAAAAAAAVAAARVAVNYAMPFPPGMMLGDIYNVSQPPTPLVGATTGAAPLYDWAPLLPQHHHHHAHTHPSHQHHHHHHQQQQQQQQQHAPQPQHHTPIIGTAAVPMTGVVDPATTTASQPATADLTNVFSTSSFQGGLMDSTMTLTDSPTSMHATAPSATPTTAPPPPSATNNSNNTSATPYHANSTSSTSSSSSSSFISTPHPMAAILPPAANLHWTDWDVYLDDRSCQQQNHPSQHRPHASRHHHSASFPQASFPHHPHPPH